MPVVTDASSSLPAAPTGKSLFSRHYLETHLPRTAEWGEDPGPAFARLAELWARGVRLGATWNENQTETEFLRPALEALGWAFIPQAAATHSGRLRRPDYALFVDAAARDEAYPLQGQDDAFYGRSLAIAEAKHWGRPLSRQSVDGREQWDASTNPSHQMVNYLVGTRSPWGILTNGQIWRLYSREVSSTASEFYEVDLGTIFAGRGQGSDVRSQESGVRGQAAVLPFSAQEGRPGGEVDAFKRFWLFFRRDAFIPDAQGRNFVQRVAAGSASYARAVSDKLKELVYQEVMPEVAGGFVAYRRERLGIREETEATRAEIYRASLGLLYKLLFILYAEARGLLPVDNSAYREESLTRMAADFADRLDRGLPLSDATHATRQYDSLLALFHRIDLGDPSLGIPRYDGGLFNPLTPENRFLETHRLSDRVVAHAVDRLVRDAGEPVDYGYISVRNLGSIYEGLLENRLPVVELPSLRRDGNSTTNDRGERKATGSYYTPDYIVDYIVRQTLGPVLDARQPVFEDAMARVAGLRGKLARTLDAGAVRVLRERLAAAEAAAREAYLGIKCCDPAMGSGHFLVNAVDFLTDGIIQRMQAYHDSHTDVPWEWNPIHQLVGRVRRDIIEEMARQGIGLDPARLDDTSLLTRLVMKRCIYGVDLNRMAVELAKLSLWLHSFTVGAPLSFLDHHLRWGNSLIGADVRTVEAAMQGQTQIKKVSAESRRLAEGRGEEAREAAGGFQFDLFGGPFAGLLDLTAVMTEVAGRADATLADVRQSADEFDAMQAALTPYKQALDLWVSQHFGNPAATELLTVHGADVLPGLRGERALSEKHQAAIAAARRLWEEKRFFHWDLEFPEVFVDLARRDWAGNPGFDAVIGNPPYVRQEQLKPFKPYFAADFAQVYHGTADLFVYFFAQGLRLLREGGRLAYISSNSWLRANYATALRAYLRDHMTVETLVDIGDNRVFVDAADVYPAIPVVRKSPPAPDQAAQVAIFTRGEGVRQFAAQVAAKLAPVAIHDQPDAGWQLGDDAGRRIFNKLMAAGRPLGEVVEGRIFFGIKTGLNEAFVVDQMTRDHLVAGDPSCAALLYPMRRGEDLRPWHQEDEGHWLIALPYRWTAANLGPGLDEPQAWQALQSRHPPLAAHLAPFAEAARRRQDKGEYWWELRPCDYYDAFDAPKIFWPDIAKSPRFVWDEFKTRIGNTAYFTSPATPYLLGILASRVTWFTISQLSQSFGERTGVQRYRLFTQTMSRLPIPDAPAADRDAIAGLALAITEQARARYALHRQVRHRILTDLGTPGAGLNQKLTAWWELDFPGFLAEARKAFKREIPVRQRDDWEGWLAARRAEHAARTAEIVRLETQLNARVYTLFDLAPAEIRIIEESTKYRYGEV